MGSVDSSVDIMDQFLDYIFGGLYDLVEDGIQAIEQLAIEAWDSITEAADETWAFVKNTATAAWDYIKIGADAAWVAIKEIADATWVWIQGVINPLLELLDTDAKATWLEVVTIAGNAYTVVTEGAVLAWAGIEKAADEVWSEMKGWVGL